MSCCLLAERVMCAYIPCIAVTVSKGNRICRRLRVHQQNGRLAIKDVNAGMSKVQASSLYIGDREDCPSSACLDSLHNSTAARADHDLCPAQSHHTAGKLGRQQGQRLLYGKTQLQAPHA